MRLYAVGESCAVLDLDTVPDPVAQRRLWWVAHRLRAQGLGSDVVPGVGNLSIFFDPARDEVEAVLQRLSDTWAAARPRAEAIGALHQLAVRYGGAAGPDLDALACGVGLTPLAVVELHTAAEYTVQCLGFLPGFAYLAGLPAQLHWPRRAQPRTQVPAGAVGIGGGQTGIYPVESPGGWNWIGRCEQALFNAHAESPCLLLPGDRVRFVAESFDA
ncbi:5-oxoprolinase subunit PxpB [Inhella gelatinilytica]|uniref:5-oxoprolinase subunit PxpB n=1 Tax=Inhella gelatinilytica TaxID=2795030 RepID=A0A931NDC7_9BURK|nr:5-oxoprolinase subunit PxpB [Inhella gelatinilytica]MBH9551316.1 5-oxoprolinase subunit PxpB [Inhella gelatinilytica]